MNLWLYLYIFRNTLYYELDVFQNTSAAGASSRPGLGVTVFVLVCLSARCSFSCLLSCSFIELVVSP